LLFPELSNPAILSRPAGLRPEALRPYLSEGLPFSKSILLLPDIYIGTVLQNFNLYLLLEDQPNID